MKHYQYFNLSTKTLAILTMLDSIKASEPKNNAHLQLDKQVNEEFIHSLEPKKPFPILYSHKSGWDRAYIGLLLGYNSGSAKLSSLERRTFPNGQSSNIAFKGSGVEFTIGWGKPFDKYYLGLEASSALYNSKGKASHTIVDGISNSSNTLITKARRNNTFGLAIRGGYIINQKVLLYGKLGVASTKFNLSTVNINSHDPNLNFAINPHKRLLGPLLAVGTEVQLNEHSLGRIEAAYIQYNRKNFLDTPDNSKVRFNPSSNEIKVGIVWLLK